MLLLSQVGTSMSHTFQQYVVWKNLNDNILAVSCTVRCIVAERHTRVRELLLLAAQSQQQTSLQTLLG